MKTTVHFGRGNANHNDRSYDKTKTEHDIFKHTIGDKNKTFLENELDVYKKLYEAKRLDTNEKYIAQRHEEKCTKSIHDYYKKNPPTELILQIGDKDNSAKGLDLQNSVVKLVNSLVNEGVTVLNVAIHKDETTEHAHIRMTFPYEKNGLIESNKTQFLREHGYERPNPDKKEDRYNNPLITFTNDVRERFIGICRDKGLEIDSEPSQEHKRHLSVHDYKMQQDRNMDFIQEHEFERKKQAIEKIVHYAESGELKSSELEKIILSLENKIEQDNIAIEEINRRIFGDTEMEI